MQTQDAINPSMLILAREARGWTQTDLARTIRVGQGTIARYELGERTPPPEHVDMIARALDFSTGFFAQHEHIVALGGDFLYRRRARVTAKDRRRVEAEANIRRLQVLRMLKLVERDDQIPFPYIDLDDVGRRPEKAAQLTRQAMRIPDGPIKSLTNWIESAGGIIFLTDFGTPQIDGTNMRMPGMPPLLFASGKVPGERHRFNLAHELGHVVMHANVSTGDAEQEANEFAAEFLMPRKLIRGDLRNLDFAAALKLKQAWGVSVAALVKRAEDLKQISTAKARRLFTTMNAQGYRLREPNPLPFEKAHAATELYRYVTDQVGFSTCEMRELLFTDRLGPVEVPSVPQMRIAGSHPDRAIN
ncbi:MAG: XRE family transcriptional regulator [Planctomycetota bacterium]